MASLILFTLPNITSEIALEVLKNATKISLICRTKENNGFELDSVTKLIERLDSNDLREAVESARKFPDQPIGKLSDLLSQRLEKKCLKKHLMPGRSFKILLKKESGI